MDNLDEIEKLSNRIISMRSATTSSLVPICIGNARALYGGIFPKGHTFDVITIRHPCRTLADYRADGLPVIRQDTYSAKLIVFIGDDFKTCVVISDCPDKLSDLHAVQGLWNGLQEDMRSAKQVVNYDGTMLFRHPMLLRPTTDGQGQRFEDPATIELQEFLASFV